MIVTCRKPKTHYSFGSIKYEYDWVHVAQVYLFTNTPCMYRSLTLGNVNVHAFDLKWCLETDDQDSIPVTTSERNLCNSFACKQDTITFTKPKTACYRCKLKLKTIIERWSNSKLILKSRTLTFMISTSLVCSKDKRDGTRSETDRQRLLSLYSNTDRADTAPLFIWGDDPERYPIICIL